MESRYLDAQVIADHLDWKVIEAITKALSWGAVVAGGAARFLQQSSHHVTDYPDDTDIYCLGDKDLELRVLDMLKSKFHPPEFVDNHRYGGHLISSYTVDVGRQYRRRAPSFSSHRIQVVDNKSLQGPHTITDVWDTFDMSICEAAIVYGQDRAVMNKHDIWLDHYMEMPNNIIKTIRPPLYVQHPDYTYPYNKTNPFVPWVGLVSDAFIEADKRHVTRYRLHPNTPFVGAMRRISKYQAKGFNFQWNDISFLLEDSTFHSFIKSMDRWVVGGEEEREMFRFLMDAAKADYLKDVL
jgi:hypothetical protein